MPDHRRRGRSRPYTAAGVRRLPCCRCGGPARFQWSCCADSGLWRPLCQSCDVEANERFLRWLGDPDADAKMARYRESLA